MNTPDAGVIASRLEVMHDLLQYLAQLPPLGGSMLSQRLEQVTEYRAYVCGVASALTQ